METPDTIYGEWMWLDSVNGQRENIQTQKFERITQGDLGYDSLMKNWKRLDLIRSMHSIRHT